MIQCIEALRYRSLRYLRQEISACQFLVGPNASGKSNFLDVVAFLGDLVIHGPLVAIQGDAKRGVRSRADDARHLCWLREGTRFELAIELLCFARNDEGATDVTRGDRHPRLKDWQGRVDLGMLHAAGVLG